MSWNMNLVYKISVESERNEHSKLKILTISALKVKFGPNELVLF